VLANFITEFTSKSDLLLVSVGLQFNCGCMMTKEVLLCVLLCVCVCVFVFNYSCAAINAIQGQLCVQNRPEWRYHSKLVRGSYPDFVQFFILPRQTLRYYHKIGHDRSLPNNCLVSIRDHFTVVVPQSSVTR